MLRLLTTIALALLLYLAPSPAWAAPPKPAVPLLPEAVLYHHPISTSSAQAQRYFDQGLLFTYGFNHGAALRSFRAATQLDPKCALCYWGIAYVLGPNINAGMDPNEIGTAWSNIQQALRLSRNATPEEQAYIQALAQRYSQQPNADRATLNQAYAKAMAKVAQQYPADLDAATLYAEAVMDTMPWDYWQENGELKPEARPIRTALESVLQKSSNHPGALHFYIHLAEKQHPEWALDAADRLRDLHIPIGHLVHMPSHIYLGVGRYADAIKANQQAVAVDAQYAQTQPAKDIYTFAYMPHNYHFLWYAATMVGQQQIALEAAHHTAAMVDPAQASQPGYGTLQHYQAIPLYTQVTFGLGDAILREQAPPTDLAYVSGVWHYARGMALVQKGQFSQASQELEQVQAIINSPSLEGVTFWEINSATSLLQIGSEVLAGKLAASQGNWSQAIEKFQQAVILEDRLKYDEPPPWHSPTRQWLAAALLKVDRPAEAEQVYREDLTRNPHNGWSLYGLAQSLEAQGKAAIARQMQQEFDRVWKGDRPPQLL